MMNEFKPLPISEEMLGAYIEGNLSLEDAQYVGQIMQTDGGLLQLFEEVSLSEVLDDTASIYDERPFFDTNFQLPELISEDAMRFFQDEFSFECWELMTPSFLSEPVTEEDLTDSSADDFTDSLIYPEVSSSVDETSSGYEGMDDYCDWNINI